MEGIVKWYNRKKDFGFIKGEDEVDYFVHHSALDGVFLRDDDKVSFEAVDTDKGKQAQNVQLLEKASERSVEGEYSEGSAENSSDDVSEDASEDSSAEEPIEENKVSEDF